MQPSANACNARTGTNWHQLAPDAAQFHIIVMFNTQHVHEVVYDSRVQLHDIEQWRRTSQATRLLFIHY